MRTLVRLGVSVLAPGAATAAIARTNTSGGSGSNASVTQGGK